MTVTASGFKKYEAKGIVLDVGQKARNDVALTVGATSEQVNVEGMNVAQVETESNELAGTVTGKEITQNDDAGTKKAWQGMHAMIQAPQSAVPFLKERVKPAPHPDRLPSDRSWFLSRRPRRGQPPPR